MIRVYFDRPEPADQADVPANQCMVGAAGELVLNLAEVGRETDPNTLKPVSVVKAITWVRTYGAASRWLYAEPIDDGENAAPDRPLEEVYTR